MADSTAIDDSSTSAQQFSLVPVDHDQFAAGSVANPQMSGLGGRFGAPNNMPDSTAIDDGLPGVPSFSLVPVDHDPFNGPSFSFVPVDSDPFAAGSVANPQTNDGFGALDNLNQPSPVDGAGMPNATSSIVQSAPNAWYKQFGIPNTQERLSPPGGLLQVVPQ